MAGDHGGASGSVDLGYYILNTYHPARDGDAARLYGRYLERVAAAEAAGFGTVWARSHNCITVLA